MPIVLQLDGLPEALEQIVNEAVERRLEEIEPSIDNLRRAPEPTGGDMRQSFLPVAHLSAGTEERK
jgi:hypothetical protein